MTELEPRPRWDKALDPLRHEASAFRVLVVVAIVAALIIAAVTVGRAL